MTDGQAGLRSWQRALVSYGGSVAIVACAVLVAVPINRWLDVSALGRVFLVAVLVSAVSFGMWPSLFASLISVLVYDFLFLPPVMSFTIQSHDDIVSLVSFAITGVAVSVLTGRVRRYRVAADDRAISAEKLAEFIRLLAPAATVGDVAALASAGLAKLFQAPTVVSLTAGEDADTTCAHPPEACRDADCQQGLRAWRHALLGGDPGPRTMRRGDWRFIRFETGKDGHGVVGLKAMPRSGLDQAHTASLVAAIVEQTAMATDRVALRLRLEDARVRERTERFRSAILACITHDIRNPLAMIAGSASLIEAEWSSLAPADAKRLLAGVRREATRLESLIGDLTQLARIDASVTVARCDSVDLLDVLHLAMDRVAERLPPARIAVQAPDPVPFVRADETLLQQVFYNVLENAAKYSEPDTLVAIRIAAHDATLRIDVTDQGSGIADAEQERVFERFYRSRDAGGIEGLGLGLSICRGFLDAMGGSISLAAAPGGGTIVSIRLLAVAPAMCEAEAS